MGNEGGKRTGGLKPVIYCDIGRGGPDELQALFDYLRAHDWLSESDSRMLGDGDVLRLSSVVSSPFATGEAKKKALILLAHSCNPKATAELGRHLTTVEPSLRGFAALALDESLQWSQGASEIPSTLS